MGPTPAPGDGGDHPPEASGDASGEYWFCLKHHRVEGRGGCRNADRLGPYPDEATAARALEIVEERNKAWDEADEHWGRGGTDS